MKLAEFFLTISDLNKHLEILKQPLNSSDKFSPISAFNRITNTGDSSYDLIGIKDLAKFMEQCEYKVECETLSLLMKLFDSQYLGKLNYSSFARMVLSTNNCSSSPNFLMNAPKQSQNIDRLDPEIEFALCRFFYKASQFLNRMVEEPEFKVVLKRHDTFRILDTENKGILDFESIREFFNKVGIKVDDNEIIGILRLIDINDDGKISEGDFELFVRILRGDLNEFYNKRLFHSPLRYIDDPEPSNNIQKLPMKSTAKKPIQQRNRLDYTSSKSRPQSPIISNRHSPVPSSRHSPIHNIEKKEMDNYAHKVCFKSPPNSKKVSPAGFKNNNNNNEIMKVKNNLYESDRNSPFRGGIKQENPFEQHYKSDTQKNGNCGQIISPRERRRPRMESSYPNPERDLIKKNEMNYQNKREINPPPVIVHRSKDKVLTEVNFNRPNLIQNFGLNGTINGTLETKQSLLQSRDKVIYSPPEKESMAYQTSRSKDNQHIVSYSENNRETMCFNPLNIRHGGKKSHLLQLKKEAVEKTHTNNQNIISQSRYYRTNEYERFIKENIPKEEATEDNLLSYRAPSKLRKRTIESRNCSRKLRQTMLESSKERDIQHIKERVKRSFKYDYGYSNKHIQKKVNLNQSYFKSEVNSPIQEMTRREHNRERNIEINNKSLKPINQNVSNDDDVLNQIGLQQGNFLEDKYLNNQGTIEEMGRTTRRTHREDTRRSREKSLRNYDSPSNRKKGRSRIKRSSGKKPRRSGRKSSRKRRDPTPGNGSRRERRPSSRRNSNRREMNKSDYSEFSKNPDTLRELTREIANSPSCKVKEKNTILNDFYENKPQSKYSPSTKTYITGEENEDIESRYTCNLSNIQSKGTQEDSLKLDRRIIEERVSPIQVRCMKENSPPQSQYNYNVSKNQESMMRRGKSPTRFFGDKYLNSSNKKSEFDITSMDRFDMERESLQITKRRRGTGSANKKVRFPFINFF